MGWSTSHSGEQVLSVLSGGITKLRFHKTIPALFLFIPSAQAHLYWAHITNPPLYRPVS